MSSATTLLHPVRSLRRHVSLDSMRGAAQGVRTGTVSVLRTGRWMEIALVGVVLISLLLARITLFPWQSEDFVVFLQAWYGHLQRAGFSGLGVEFANYNVPYLYLLLIGAKTGANGLDWIKSISTISDLVMALGCFALLRHFPASRRYALVGAAAVLVLPEVLLNSAVWGQADSTYTALLVWAVYAALRGRSIPAWMLFGLALSFKLQAAFILPAFLVLHVTRRWSWRGPVAAAGVLLATEIPALVAGRSVESLASIYLNQSGEFALLSMGVPNVWALMPEMNHDMLRSAGMLFAVACVALLTYVVLSAARRAPLNDRTALLAIATTVAVAVYTLPTMHERYFYAANVLLFVYAFIDRRALPWALVAQLVALLSYTPFLFKTAPALSIPVLAIVQAVVLFWMLRELIRSMNAEQTMSLEPNQQAVGVL